MKNRYGDEYYWEQTGDKEYRFVMEGTSMDYCRMGGKRGQENIDMNDLGMFDPSGGPFVEVGGKIYWDEIADLQVADQQPLTIERIRYDGDNFIVKVE